MLESNRDGYEDGKNAHATLLPTESPKYSTWSNLPKLLRTHVPFGIATISFLQILSFATLADFQKLLRFSPQRITQLWRFITYMFLHENCIHLSLNVSLQILFAYFLELRHHRLKILLLYFFGGITAVLGASCFHSNLIIGASGGVYTLLLSHLSDVIMNFDSIKYKKQRFCSVVLIVLFDVVYNVIHFYTNSNPVISWQTHGVGGVTGILLGAVLFKKKECGNGQLWFFWTSLILYGLLVACLVTLTVQIKKCTPANVKTDYVYFC